MVSGRPRLVSDHRRSACPHRGAPCRPGYIAFALCSAVLAWRGQRVRWQLVELLAAHEIPSIENDVYPELYFGDARMAGCCL
jgi:hypothetical protein